MKLKGGAKDVAVELKKKHAESLNERQLRMKKEAEVRAQTLQQLAEEDRLAKEKKQLKKIELRRIMDLDA